MTIQALPVTAPSAENERVRQRIEAELAALLGTRLAELRFLGRDITPFEQVLAAMVTGPGKRLRPAFVYWGYRAAGGDAESPEADVAVRVGCAMEFLHASAVICDDLMDGSPTRRGVPAVHVQLADQHTRLGWRGDPERFGSAAAIVLGLQAYTWADAAICDAGLSLPRLAEVLRIFTMLRTEVIGGQYLDLAGSSRPGDPAAASTAGRIALYKSAKYTVERPLQLGAAVAGRPAIGFLSEYGLRVGEAFQLRDDVLGVFGDPAVTGKAADEDIRAGKQTLLLAFARQLAGEAERARLDAVAGNAAATPAEVAWVRGLLARCGALDAVERRITALVTQARAALAGSGPMPEAARDALRTLAGCATERAR